MSRRLLLRRRRSAPKIAVKPTETKSDCASKCCKTKCCKPKKPTPKVTRNQEDDVFEIQGITLRDPDTNKTFKLKANAAVRDAFGCICKEEEETSNSLIPDHVLAMALQNAK
tara:strand:- start:108 stop:443 length:336 start_codon:yes stop_codon:yes gene_type:complete